MSHRGRGGTVLLLVLVVVTAALYGVSRAALRLPAPTGTTPGFSPTAAAKPTAGASVVLPSGAGTFTYAGIDGAVVGTEGPLQRYRVGVEDGLGVDAEQFATAVEAILSDPRSWTAGGTLRFQRVSGVAGQEFTVLLASPVLSEALCAEDGLTTEQYTNCRLSDGRIVINSARWLTGVAGYGAPLSEYRSYAVNHEVGHQLGYGHELCPGAGQPAPVMEQQTLGLHGCRAYGWPYRDGFHYIGPPAAA